MLEDDFVFSCGEATESRPHFLPTLGGGEPTFPQGQGRAGGDGALVLFVEEEHLSPTD